MAMLRICAADECNTKTLGKHCIEHEYIPRIAAGSRLDARPQLPVRAAA
jgi:hypothetical protein